MNSVDYRDVLVDLKTRRDMLNGLIQGIEQLMGPEPEPVKNAVPVRQKRAYKKAAAAKIARVLVPAPTPSLSMTDAIRQAVKEAPRTAVEVADRVQQLLPSASRNSVSTIISQRLSAGEFRENDHLQLRFAESGNGAHA